MRFSYALALASLTTLIALPAAAATIPGGNLTTQTWTAAGNPYVVQGDITVPNGATLTIESGVVVQFATTDATGSGSNSSRCELIVAAGGDLVVNGTAAEPVLFNSSASGAGQWIGVYLEPGSDASLVGLTIEEASVGIEAHGSPTLLSDLLFRSNSTGLFVGSSASVTLVNSVLTQNSTALRLSGGGASLTLDHGTVHNNSNDGFWVQSGTAQVTDSILTQNGGQGIDRDGGSVNVTRSLLWQNSGGNVSGFVTTDAATDGLQANPLYVSGSNLELTSRSPARFQGAGGSDIGAIPYDSTATPGFYGTLWTDTTVPSGVTNVAGDLTVPTGVTLTLEAGATLSFATTDIMISPRNTSRPELRVYGTLVTTGTGSNPVVMNSTASGAGQWIGVYLEVGSDASLEGLTIEEASVGIEAHDSPTRMSGLLFRSNSTGLFVGSSASVTLVNSVLTQNSTALRLSGGGASLTLDHGTVHNNSNDGFWVQSGTAQVTDSILTQNGGQGIDRDGGSVNVTRSLLWQNSGGNVSGFVTTDAATDGLQANPLYVSGSNLELTSRSPARFQGAGGSDIGAIPYDSTATPGFYGTLWTDTTVPSGVTNVAGDLTVPTGVTLTLEAGATLSFATTDIMISPRNTSRPELRVYGTLVTTGTGSNPVVMNSTASGAGQWIGVYLEVGSDASLEGLTIEEASVGIEAHDSPTRMSGLLFRSNSTGLFVASSASVTLVNSVLTQNSTALRLSGGGASLTLDHGTVHNNSNDGFWVQSGTALVRGSILTQNGGQGIDRDGGSATVTTSDLWMNSGGNISGSVSTDASVININPFYVSGSDLRLTITSPCVDAIAASGPATDYDNKSRPINGDGLNGAEWDMGAFEFSSVANCGDGIIGAGEACDDGASNGMYGFCNGTCTAEGPNCGDGTMNGPEQCDDGNADDSDDCLSTCLNATCGDSIVWSGMEECDDGNADDMDGCVSCSTAICGDGVVFTGMEDCDDMNDVDTDACVSCVAATCGDGFVQAGEEECDDGNGSNVDACTNACEVARCGDGIVGPGEACDDGNDIDTDACSNTCRDADCGDGITQDGEECDDMNLVNDDECTNSCMLPACGDGIIQTGEQCDDGNDVDTDTCSNSCMNAACGDGIQQTGEECDDGNSNPNDACTTACQNAVCGDGFRQTGVEGCDDGNDLNDDGCVMGCVVASCGDSYVRDGVEACDDGNDVDDDGCTNICSLSSCGDGMLQPGEDCDDGNASNIDDCLNTCLNPSCGDGFIRVGMEACDDGNDLDTDACLSTCRNASCGDGFVQAGVEECDDGNGAQTDSCLVSCEDATCGDGQVQDGVEECDDGNDMAGDGCSPSCFEDATSMPDGGMPMPDGGVPAGDGGSPPADGGPIGREDGGCGCRAAGVPSDNASWLLGLLALGLLTRRRRR